MIDTWRRNDGNWQGVTRYTAPVADAAAGVPGAAPNKPAIEEKI